jgi:PAS domain S-box-containing protein
VDNASEAVIVLQDNRMRFFNRKTLEMSGYSSQEITAKTISEFVYPQDRQMVNDIYSKRLQGKDIQSSYEFRMLQKNGNTLWVNINSVLITWNGKPATLALVTDISERKKIEQMLKEYAQKITQVQEEERKKIAYELHDDTAQYLSILKLEIESLLHSGEIRSPEILHKLEFLQKDAERAFNDVRRYSHELRPGVLDIGTTGRLEQIAGTMTKWVKSR